MILILEGQEVDLNDEAALVEAIKSRTERVIGPLPAEGAAERERQAFSFITFIALKTGALAAYHEATGTAVDVENVREIASQLEELTGLKFATEFAIPPPSIIVPPAAATEGEDDAAQEG